MASEALLVICAGIMIEGLVRVMACCAGEARIPIAPATAALQPIRLKAHVFHAQYSRSMDFVPSTVTSAAKINLRNRPQIPWVENRLPTLCILFIVHELCMFRAGTMTSFAMHSKHEARGIKSRPRCRCGRMTAKTTAQSIWINKPTHRQTKGWRRLGRVAWGQIQALQTSKEAHSALVERAISLINVSLALVS
jgi:hypothetical protein